MLRRWGHLAALAAATSLAATEGPGVDQFIQAVRAEGVIQIDGRLDEAAWQTAPVFDAFVQRYPTVGAPTERTELRVLYDDQHLYVSVVCFDRNEVMRVLGRRDSGEVGDTVTIVLDPTHDHRTGYTFMVNAGGVQTDGVLFDDTNFTPDWDAVWDSAVEVFDGGWRVELALPLHLFRYPNVEVQTWGFGVRREIFRTREDIVSSMNSRDSGALVSRLGHLTGLRGLSQKRTLELLPYLSGRTLLSLGAPTSSRLLLPAADVGLDLKLGLSSSLNLTAAFNPDFGQVEADKVILNLSPNETFFPEKRPFFTQGLELFAPVGSEFGGAPFQLFYSRRVGLETPILAAAKLTGSVVPGLEVSVLDAVVAGPHNDPADDGDPAAWPYYRVSRPLHLGTRAALPSTERVPYNYFAGVARYSLGGNSRVGASVSAATPLTATCAAEDDPLRPSCRARGGNAAGVDWNLRTPGGEWGVMGQLVASQAVGGPPQRQLRDGTVLARGGLGHGGYVRAGRTGGQHVYGLQYDYSSPTLELNALGFQRTNNEQAISARYRFQQSTGMGALKALQGRVSAGQRFTTAALAPDRPETPEREDRLFSRTGFVNLGGGVTLPSFDDLGFEAGAELPGYDIREIPRSGIPFQVAARGYLGLYVGTHAARPWRLSGFAAIGARAPDEVIREVRNGWIVDGAFRLRPANALETSLEVTYDRTEFGPRYIRTLRTDPLEDGGTFLFGDLQSNFLSLTLRQQWIVTPRLALQAYAQLFTSYGVYRGGFLEETSHRGRPIRYRDLRPVAGAPAGENHDFHTTSLNVNLLLRWEYRLGSNLFFVYTRSQSGAQAQGQPAPRSLFPHGLSSGAAHDGFLVKWTYYWSA